MLTLSVSALRTSLNFDYRPDHVRGLLNSLLCHMASNDIIIGTPQRIELAKARVSDFHSVISDIHLHQSIESNDIVNDWVSMVANQTRSGFKTYYSIEPGTHSHSIKAAPITSKTTPTASTPTPATPTPARNIPSYISGRIRKTTLHDGGHMTCVAVDYLQYSLISHDNQPLPSKQQLDDTSHDDHMTEEGKKYTETYRRMEFVPYQPLPLAIEEALYPVYSSRYVEHDDPLWPNKLQCLELVEGASDGLPRFTGTFLTPEARGVRYDTLALHGVTYCVLYLAVFVICFHPVSHPLLLAPPMPHPHVQICIPYHIVWLQWITWRAWSTETTLPPLTSLQRVLSSK